MIHFNLNLNNTPDPFQLQDENGEPCAKSKLLFTLMLATGLNRLSTSFTIFEFLYRTGIILKKYGVIDNFFTNDLLLRLENADGDIELYLEDIINHLGIEISDAPDDFIPRWRWFTEIDQYWKNAAVGALLSQFPTLGIEKIKGNQYAIGLKPGEPDDKTCNNARLFAKAAMKTIGGKRINCTAKRVKERSKALKEFKEYLDTTIPNEFDFISVPLEVRNRFYELIEGPIESDRAYYESLINEEGTPFAKLVFLTWLFANGYAVEHKIIRTDGKKAIYAEVDPRFEKYGDFEYSDYDGINHLGFGINIVSTFYDLELDTLAHLLKEE